MMKLNWDQALGYILIVVASCFWGASASLGKTLMQNGLSTIMLMQVRSLITASTLFLLLLVFARSHLRIRFQDLSGFLLLGIPGLALVNASYYKAVQLLSIALAVFVQFTAPVLIFIYGLASKKEKATAGKWIALFCSLLGTYLMVQLHKSSREPVSWFGLVCAFVSMLSYAFYVVLSHRLGQKHSPWTMIVYGYGIAAVFWCLVQSVPDTFHQLAQNHLWSRVVLFSVVSTLIPFSVFLSGLRRVTPTGASIASTSETVSASLAAYLILGEALTLGQIIGAGMILTALLVLIYQSKTVPVLEEF